MTRLLARRLLLLFPTLFGISLLTFILLRWIPGDPIQTMLGERATAEQVARYRAANGLDAPIPIQYWRYAENLARGDWGRSITTNLPVLTELAQRLPATIELGLAAMLIACALGIPMGVLAAYRRNSLFDWVASGATLIGVSVPLFWLGLGLSYLMGYRLGWLPPSGRLTIGIELQTVTNLYVLDSLLTANCAALVDALKHLALPALTLSTVPLAIIGRMTRACLLDVLAQDYVRTARAKGLGEHVVLLTHAFKNAMPPIVTVIGLQLGLLFSGAILTETIFSFPGLGQLVAERVLARDYPIIQGVVVVTALLFVLVNLAADALYLYLNPRIRYD
ncbi:MAG: ABC transporter permease [Chloroflexi bacterium]|nr:ABC transporter permease [Chloroflexota bacterium]